MLCFVVCNVDLGSMVNARNDIATEFVTDVN